MAELYRNYNNDEDSREKNSPKHENFDDNTKVVASHYNQILETGTDHRKTSRIFFMRNFNNWIKSMLITEYLAKIKDNMKLGDPLRVLDMCSGKGGDLLKWQKGNISHLICTDIASVSVEQCEERYRQSSSRNSHNFTAEFFACDSTLVRLREKFKDPSMDLNLVSCQFAFHYSFESLKQAECMLRNAAECLRPGGFFIGTMPDAFEIMKRQREARSDIFGNEVYQISFQCDTSDVPLFGAKYNFHLEGVVDCPEFLVHFPTFVRLARKYGLELVEKDRFEDFYQKMILKGKSLLERMKGMETYPAFENNDLVSSEDNDYVHASEYIAGGRKHIGTLSKAEWEATSKIFIFFKFFFVRILNFIVFTALYMTFAFKKMNTQWNAEGKPEYI